METGKPNLPERITHPAHHHSLVLRTYDEVRFKYGDSTSSCCNLCLSKFEKGDYVYACDISTDGGCASTLDYFCPCSIALGIGRVFMVDTTCSSIKGRVDFRGHGDMLYFLDRVDPSHPRKCQSCQGYTDDHLFRCLLNCCDYSLHLSCGPLPVSIQYHHSGHELTLTLTDALLDGADSEDTWCDVCEEQRDPMKCVYRSEDPPFTATIDCVLPQIVGALQGDYGEVKLRSVRQHIPGKVVVAAGAQGDAEEVIVERNIETNAADVENNVDFIFHGEEFLTLDDGHLFDSLTREDVELLGHAAADLERRLLEGVPTFKFSDEAFEQFKEHAIIGKFDLESLSLYYEMNGSQRLIKVGSNFVEPELLPLYLQIVDKHGDFAAGCPLSPIMKAGLLMRLLILIQGIQGLKTCEVTGDLLCTWQFYLEYVGGKLGFDVQFARDNLEKLACACYALKFVKVRDDITADLTQQIEQLKRDIPEDKPKIEGLKEQHRRAKESVFVKQCLAEASALKWKNAGEFLGMDQVEE